MRILLIFDLPTDTSIDAKNYRNFRRFLIKNGFLMEQESCYTKILLNKTSLDIFLKKIEKNKPERGNVQIFMMTEKQYERRLFLIGSSNNDVLNTTDRLVIL